MDRDYMRNWYALLICIFNPDMTTDEALKAMGFVVPDLGDDTDG